MKKGDLLIILLCLLLAALPLLMLLPASAPPAQVLVRVDGELQHSLPLSRGRVLTVSTPYGSNTLCIEQGTVSITASDCPDGTCMRMGPISRTGETLVCLPHRLTVEITGAPSSADAVTQ